MVQLFLLVLSLDQASDSRAPEVLPRPDQATQQEVALILKSLTAERSLVPVTPSRLTVGIVVTHETQSQRKAAVVKSQLLAVGEHLGRQIEVRTILAEDGLGQRGDVDVVYVTPVDSRWIEPIVSWTRRHRVLSFTGVPAYASKGVAVAVDPGGKIIINRVAGDAVGAEFSSGLLRVATVID